PATSSCTVLYDVSGGGVIRKKRVPGVAVDFSGCRQVVGLLESHKRLAKVVAVLAVDFARRKTVAVEQHLGFDDQRRINAGPLRGRYIDGFRRQRRGSGRRCMRNVSVRSRIRNRKRRQCDEKSNDRQYSHIPSTSLPLMRSRLTFARRGTNRGARHCTN